MQGPELIVMVDAPNAVAPGRYLSEVRDKISPLGLICERMMKLVLPLDVMLVTGRGQEHDVYGSFAAMKGLFLNRIYEEEQATRTVNAAMGRRAKTFIRVDARHTFADPELLQGLLEHHRARGSQYTYFENVPAWLGGEVFDTSPLLDAFVAARAAGDLDIEPGEMLKKYSEDLKTASYRPRLRGKWKYQNLELGDPGSEASLINEIRLHQNPAAVTYKDFLV